MSLATTVRQLLDADESVVSIEPTILQEHAHDKWFASHVPELVVFARNTEDVSRLLRFANEESIPITARGGGYGYVGGCVPARGGIALSLIKMNRIKEVSATDFVAVVESGVFTEQLQNAAKAQGLFYPPDPASKAHSTIGGNVATNAGGPRCLKYGVTRHYVLGLEIVLANGEVIQLGGRTHKNKTGFDLVSLFVGSEGMLGIVTEVTLRLLPLPPSRAAISIVFPNLIQAAAAVQAVFAAGYLPAAVEIADQFTLEAARQVAGSERVPKGDAHLLIEIDGQLETTRLELRALEQLLNSLVPGGFPVPPKLAFGETKCEQLWALRRGFSEALRAQQDLIKFNEDIVVPRSGLVPLLECTAQMQTRYPFRIACFGHAGDGNIHVNLMVDKDYPQNPTLQNQITEALDELFDFVLQLGGTITGEHGIGLAKKRWWPKAISPAVHELHTKIKQALDPKGILNPGKFL